MLLFVYARSSNRDQRCRSSARTGEANGIRINNCAQTVQRARSGYITIIFPFLSSGILFVYLFTQSGHFCVRNVCTHVCATFGDECWFTKQTNTHTHGINQRASSPHNYFVRELLYLTTTAARTLIKKRAYLPPAHHAHRSRVRNAREFELPLKCVWFGVYVCVYERAAV